MVNNNNELIVHIKKLKENAIIPKYETTGAVGMDLHACIDEKKVIYRKTKGTFPLYPGQVKLFGTGISISIPKGYEGQVRARSGLALKYGIGVMNGVGSLDPDYTGEIGVILFNFGNEIFEVKNGDRIAQILLNKIPRFKFVEVDELDETDRGDGGFGHTGR